MSDGKLTPDGSSKAEFFAALAPKPVFQFTSYGAGEIYVTEMRANTWKKSPSSSRKATLTAYLRLTMESKGSLLRK